METLKFDLSKSGGSFKILNATNGGPWHRRYSNDQYRSNFESYKAARIPFSRNHDSNFCVVYGGPFAHDVSVIFPCFDADVNDPNSYDFACTDESILCCLDAGTKTFFRLGQSIEHQIKKHDTLPPKDFGKWAEICEHIIRHYTEGWANGYNLDISYWEIWNEPDLYFRADASKRPTWGGTQAQFFDFYEIVSKHLKTCFPNLKIGGPALAGDEAWAEDFLCHMQKRNVELDFFSWHIYCNEPDKMSGKAARIRALMNKYGYNDAESILNEWNYVQGWAGDDFVYSIKSIHGIKGAAFTMACMSLAQSSDIDMLMYYDTRESAFCGAFDYYTYEPLKGYYPLYWYGMFYDAKEEVKADNSIENIYSLCGVYEDGKILAVVTYYSNDDSAPNKSIKIDFGKKSEFDIYLLDSEHDGELIKTTDTLEFDMCIHSAILIKEK